jgi:hypothetical protein
VQTLLISVGKVTICRITLVLLIVYEFHVSECIGTMKDSHFDRPSALSMTLSLTNLDFIGCHPYKI